MTRRDGIAVATAIAAAADLGRVRPVGARALEDTAAC